MMTLGLLDVRACCSATMCFATRVLEDRLHLVSPGSLIHDLIQHLFVSSAVKRVVLRVVRHVVEIDAAA